VVYTFFDSVRYLNLRDEPIPALLLQKWANSSTVTPEVSQLLKWPKRDG
jgi:hypothetical protein